MGKLGGRKFVGFLVSVMAVGFLHQNANEATVTAIGAVGLLYGAFCGANGFIEGRHAGKAGG